MNSFLADARYAARSLLGSPGLSLIVIVTIALGIGANTAVFTVVNGVLLSDLPYPDPEELVRIWPEKVLSETMLTDLRERMTSFRAISVYRPDTLTLLQETNADVVNVLVVSANHFGVLGVPPALGRDFRDEDQWAGREDVVLLSHAAWQSRFAGSDAVIGQSIRLGGRGHASRTVIGVMPRGYQPIAGSPEAWIPVSLDPDSSAFAGAYGLRALARLLPEATAEQARGEVAALVPEFTELHPTQFRAARHSPTDVVRLDETIVRGVRPALLTLLGAVGFVLLIACSNVANLLLARGVSRRRESAIRVALGARTARIVRQQLTESGILALLGAVAGGGLGSALVSVLMGQIPQYVPRAETISLDPRVLGFTLLAAVVSALLFGAAPAANAARVDMRAELVGGGDRSATGGRHRYRINNTLVVAEVALAVALVAGSGLLLRSLLRLGAVDAGFEPDRVLAIAVNLPAGPYDEASARRQYFEAAFARLALIPGVEAVGAINLLPLSGGNTGFPYTVEGQPLPADTPSLVGNVRAVTPGHFEAFGIALQRGRMLQATDTADADPVGLINESMARRHWHWPAEDPTGARFLDGAGNPIFTVVGVVSDIRQQSLAADPSPEFYVHADLFGWQVRQIVVRTTGPARPLLGPVADAVRAVDAAVPLVARVTMDDVMTSSLGEPRFFTGLFSAFGVLGMALAIIGVYGVTSYTMRQRTREFAIRMALGADSGQVLRLSLKRAMMPVLIGVGLGTVLGISVTRLLAGFLYGIPPNDPLTFGVVAAALVTASAVAGLLPARRASRVDATVALGQE